MRIRSACAALGAALAAVLLANASRAQTLEKPPLDWADRRLVLEGVLGFGTPVGLAGVMARFDVAPWVSIGAGIGRTLGGPQCAALILGRLPVARSRKALLALTLESGYSTGAAYDYDPNPSCWDCAHMWTRPVYHVRNAHWVDMELGLEVRFASGFSVRPFAGIAKLVNPGSATCKTYDQVTRDWSPAPCDPPINRASEGSSAFFPNLDGPSGDGDMIFVLGIAIGYAFAL